MSHTKPGKQKNRIAARARSINTLIFVSALVLITAAAAVMVSNINSDASKKLARAYSVEAAKEFYSYISQDLAFVRKVSHSRAVTQWFVDAGNQVKRAAAYGEMMDYIGMLRSAHLYFGISATMNEYSIESGATLADFVPFGKLSPSKPEDAWYFDCISSENAYVLSIDIDKFTHRWHLWITHKVMADEKIVGAFASGLQIRTLLQTMFGKYDAQNLKGYVVDKHGAVLMDSAFSEFSIPEDKRRIHEEHPDPAFALAIDSYLKRIDGFFGPQEQPEVIKLAAGTYRYASVAPIVGSDWSVVVFFKSDLLSDFTRILPLLVVLPVVFFLYVAVRNALMRRFLFTPLSRLTQSVSAVQPDTIDIFGSDRDDEVGELARAIRAMWDRLSSYNSELLHATHERQRQTRLLRTVNSAAAALLKTAGEKSFEASLLEGMGLIGRCMDVDRVSFWRSETRDGVRRYVLQHEWLSDIGRQGKALPNHTELSHGDHPEWEGKLMRDECIDGPLISLSRDAQALLRPYGVRSVLIIPMYVQEQFWGFVRFDDCHRDRAFAEDEADILRSASLMMVSVAHRQMKEKRQETLSALEADAEEGHGRQPS